MRRKSHVRFCNGGGAVARSTDRNQPTRYTRREQRYLAGVSSFVGWRALPVTACG
jgi:hypothetical protein